MLVTILSRVVLLGQEVDGLVDDLGHQYISASQLATILGVSKNNGARDFERWVPSIVWLKSKTPLNNKHCNIIPIDQANLIVQTLATRGNQLACELLGISVKSRQRNPSTQHVYLMTTEDGLYVKIGISVDPLKRLSGVQTGCPCRVTLFKVIPSKKARILEGYLHRVLKDFNTVGEWFDASILSIVNWD